jgi:heptaprenyl diphosphate synthase
MTAMAELVDAGGKRLRPALLLLSARLGDYALDRVLPACLAVELMHNATLMHDDVIDRSPVRRGRPTAFAAHGEALAIVAGDHYFSRAYELLAACGDTVNIELLAGALQAVCRGELAQQHDRFRYRLNEQDYLRRIEDKTAALLAVSCRLGARLGGLDERQQESLTVFGSRLGAAFQVADDVLDYTGEEAQLGKPVGQDLLEGNSTLPLMLAYASPTLAEELDRHLTQGEPPAAEEAARAVAIVRSSDAPARALERAGELAKQALAALAEFPPSAALAALQRLTEYVVARNL